jgi:Orsellinic acid/F9775 biosynthesis cluster protein D
MSDRCLFYDDLRQLLFCTLCKRVITPGTILRHLQLPAHSGLTATDREGLRDRFGDVATISVKGLSDEVIQRLFDQGPFPHLAVQPGWSCLTCHFAAVEQSTAARHQCPGEPQLARVPAVSRFTGNSPYFTVPARFIPRPASTIVSESWEHVLRRHDRLLVETQQRLHNVVAPDEVGHRPLWDLRTGWLEWLAHVDMADLIPLCSLQSEVDDALGTAVVSLREVIKSTFLAWHRRLDRDDQTMVSGNLLLRIVQSYQEDTCQEPFTPLRNPHSLFAYINTFQRILLFVLRVAQLTPERRCGLGVPITSTQVDLATRIVEIARTQPPEEEEEPGSIGEPLLALARSLIEQDLDSGPRRSPVSFSLAILGWDAKRSRWRAPNAHSQLLSHLIYVFRVVALHHVSSQLEPGQSRTDALRAYCVTYLRVGRAYIFDELHNQRNLALNLAPDCYGRPTVFWEDGYETLVVKGRRVLRSRICDWIASLITEAREILCAELLFASTADVLALDIRDYPDQLAFANHRGSIVDLHPALQGGLQRVVTRLERYHPESTFAQVPRLSLAGKKNGRLAL